MCGNYNPENNAQMWGYGLLGLGLRSAHLMNTELVIVGVNTLFCYVCGGTML